MHPLSLSRALVKLKESIFPYLVDRRRIVPNSDLQVVAFILAGFSVSPSKENLLNKTDKKGEAAKETTEIEMDYFHYY